MTDRDRLIELLNKVKGTYFFAGDNNLNLLADYLLTNGIIVPPCKFGDKVYMRFEGEVIPLTIIRITTLETVDGISRCYDAKNKLVATSFTDRHIGKTVFLTKEEAEEKLKERAE